MNNITYTISELNNEKYQYNDVNNDINDKIDISLLLYNTI